MYQIQDKGKSQGRFKVRLYQLCCNIHSVRIPPLPYQVWYLSFQSSYLLLLFTVLEYHHYHTKFWYLSFQSSLLLLLLLFVRTPIQYTIGLASLSSARSPSLSSRSVAGVWSKDWVVVCRSGRVLRVVVVGDRRSRFFVFFSPFLEGGG